MLKENNLHSNSTPNFEDMTNLQDQMGEQRAQSCCAMASSSIRIEQFEPAPLLLNVSHALL